jgi:hypothetical protein
MLFAVESNSLESAIWSAVSQLAVLAIVGFVANIVIRRFREVSTARQDLLKEIDAFSIHLYKPRKLYQVMIDRCGDLLTGISNPDQRECARLEAIHKALADVVDATGRLRTFQVKIIQLYGYDMDLLAHYLAIWRYMKEIRRRMEKGESLYFTNEKPESSDAFYRLFDSFRYRVSKAKYPWRQPEIAQPPPDLLAKMRAAGDKVYQQFFGVTPDRGTSGEIAL